MPEINDIAKKLQGQRTVFLLDNIDHDRAEKVCQMLIGLALESDKEIRLIVDCDGGNASPAFSICDTIASIRVPVIGVVMGNCWSMAVPILQSCSRRVASPHSVFLLHCIKTSFDFSHSLPKKTIRAIFERRLLEGRDWQVRFERFIAKRAGKSQAAIRKLMCDGDVLDARLSAEEALAHNLIDEIIDPKSVFVRK
ncbi:MAG TPA: ATP-dependent Clp protease proteolytic subunit [Candidatus Paceibacterota bacterium]|nr:ATP-dependent Clp protease proteolytic subunit [Candidatus Paceibacterota bacterium]